MSDQTSAPDFLSGVRSAVEAVVDPEIGEPLGKIGMVRSVTAEGDQQARVVIELPTPAYPEPERIADAIRRAIPEGTSAEVDFTATVRGKESGGKLGLRIKNVIAVGSGKGGVGKSTVAACLAHGLRHYGCSVGIMDADVYGPSLGHLLSLAGQPAVKEYPRGEGEPPLRKMQPLDSGGIKAMSMAFFVDPGQAVVWRGPMLHKALEQFLRDTDWGELDYLVIDLPPGTGDVSLTLSQLLGLAGAVVVCTPQQVALLDAIKAIHMYNQVKVPVLGIVENMSGDIFGQGGARKAANELGLPFLGELPIDAKVRVQGDAGDLAALFADDSPVRDELLAITQRVAVSVARELVTAPELPQLEIL